MHQFDIPPVCCSGSLSLTYAFISMLWVKKKVSPSTMAAFVENPCEGPYSLCGHSSLLTRNVNAIFHANVDTPNWFVE